MATKKKTAVTEPEQTPELQEDAVLPEEPVEETPEPFVLLADDELPPDTIRYRVNWPGGVSLREGPGQAYVRKRILPFGTVVLSRSTTDLLLREDRSREDPFWLRVVCEAERGWVDGAYLERIDEPAE